MEPHGPIDAAAAALNSQDAAVEAFSSPASTVQSDFDDFEDDLEDTEGLVASVPSASAVASDLGAPAALGPEPDVGSQAHIANDNDTDDLDVSMLARLYEMKMGDLQRAEAPLKSPAIKRPKAGGGGVGFGRGVAGKSASTRPRTGGGAAAANSAATPKRRPAAAAPAGSAGLQPLGTFNAAVRCAARVGQTVWAAERDGALVVRCAHSAKLLERACSGHDWEAILCLAPVGARAVWCGTDSGPILVFDRSSRTLLLEARQHAGCVHCLCAAPAAAAFVVSGGADWRLNMWHPDGRHMKTLSGHKGGVRCLLVVGMHIWSGSDDSSVRVWDAACGRFQLTTQPCRATLTGHTGAVHAIVPYGDVSPHLPTPLHPSPAPDPMAMCAKPPPAYPPTPLPCP